MKILREILIFSLLGILIPSPLYLQEKIDNEVMVKIRDKGLKRSQVMDLVFFMTEIYGPRLAGTQAYLQAAQWAGKKFEEFGVKKVKIEPWGKENWPDPFSFFIPFFIRSNMGA